MRCGGEPEPSRKRCAECAERDNEHVRQWYRKNWARGKEMQRLGSFRWRLKHTYGITLDEYEAMIVLQQGQCAICQQELPLEIDHDHATGAVRGLLCRPCNLSIGKFEEDPIRLQRAIDYLSRNNSV